jgi:hypothetical protein
MGRLVVRKEVERIDERGAEVVVGVDRVTGGGEVGQGRETEVVGIDPGRVTEGTEAVIDGTVAVTEADRAGMTPS